MFWAAVILFSDLKSRQWVRFCYTVWLGLNFCSQFLFCFVFGLSFKSNNNNDDDNLTYYDYYFLFIGGLRLIYTISPLGSSYMLPT